MNKDKIRSVTAFILIVILGISLFTFTTRFIRKTNKETKEIQKKNNRSSKRNRWSISNKPTKTRNTKIRGNCFCEKLYFN